MQVLRTIGAALGRISVGRNSFSTSQQAVMFNKKLVFAACVVWFVRPRSLLWCQCCLSIAVPGHQGMVGRRLGQHHAQLPAFAVWLRIQIPGPSQPGLLMAALPRQLLLVHPGWAAHLQQPQASFSA